MKNRKTWRLVGLGLCAIILLFNSSCYLLQTTDDSSEITITIEPQIIEMNVGEQEQIKVTVTPDTYQGQIDIKYGLSKDTLAEVEGGKNYAILTAWSAGTETLTATAPNGYTAECLVNIKKASSDDVYLTTTKRIVQTCVGASQMLTASLVGGSSTDQDNIVWKLNNSSLGTIIGSGSSVLFQCTGSGNGSITITHPKAGTSITITLVCGGDGIQLELNEYQASLTVGQYEEVSVYIDNIPDGVTVNASDITWELLVPDGETAIGTLLTTTGYSCVFSATAAGTQKLVAKYTNGAKAYCTLVVSESEGLSVTTTALQMMPLQTRTFSYTPQPASAVVKVTNSNSAVCSVTQDADAKTITVTTAEEGTATIVLSTGLSTTAEVYVSSVWKDTLELEQTKVSGVAGDGAVKSIPYTVTPPNATVTATLRSGNVSGLTVDKVNKCIKFVDSSEGTATIDVSASNGQSATVTVDVTATSAAFGCGMTVVSSGESLDPPGPPGIGFFWFANGEARMGINEGRTVIIYLSAAPAGLVWTGAIAYTAAGEGSTGKLSVSIAADQKSVQLTYSPSWTLTTAEYDGGTLVLSATHPATGITSYYTVTIYCYAKAGN